MFLCSIALHDYPIASWCKAMAECLMAIEQPADAIAGSLIVIVQSRMAIV
jgi:hypothetical protein